jgi:hypothetical protein
VTRQRRADRGGRDTNTKAQQLALDALVTPVGVLPGQPDDQLLDVLVKRWPAGLAVRVGPDAGDQSAVPARWRLGLDEEAGPAGSRERAADGGKEGSVGWLEPRPWNLAAQHGQLVMEHHNLQVLGSIAAGEQDEQLEGAAQREVDEFRKHAEAGLPSRAAGKSPTEPSVATPQLKGHVRLCAPFTPRKGRTTRPCP